MKSRRVLVSTALWCSAVLLCRPCLTAAFSTPARRALKPSRSLAASSRTTSVAGALFLSSPSSVVEEAATTANDRKPSGTTSPSLQSAVATTSATSSEYQKGLLVIGFITLLFSSNSPVLHYAFSDASVAPPVLLLNAAVSSVALVGLLLGGEKLESSTPLQSALSDKETDRNLALKGGLELGLWKFLGTTLNLYGLSLTTAAHGAFLIQLTTLIVPVVQGIQGVPIPRRIQTAVVLALAGVVCFTQDATTLATASASNGALGDALCVLAAVFYATYDLRLFSWGKQVRPRRLITGKIATQALLSILLLLAVGDSWHEALDYVMTTAANMDDWPRILGVVVWSGVAVNAVAPYLQVGGQQAVGPTRCQTIYASQPLWASMMSYAFLGEKIGLQGLLGGTAFLSALFLAATADAPDPDCEQEVCEV